AESHFKISNKWPSIIPCFGLTQNPSNKNYMLVIDKADIDLRKYLQQIQNQLTWKERIKVAYDIIVALSIIHGENVIHRDLHSGNILYSKLDQVCYISDLGFCGPADKSTKSIYGNLPYIAPEVISGKKTTIKSDIYSIGMLMWEISSGQPPFNYYENDYKINNTILITKTSYTLPAGEQAYDSNLKWFFQVTLGDILAVLLYFLWFYVPLSRKLFTYRFCKVSYGGIGYWNLEMKGFDWVPGWKLETISASSNLLIIGQIVFWSP
ncbi:kinase-like protein, partial [Rhizophagus irregularis]